MLRPLLVVVRTDDLFSLLCCSLFSRRFAILDRSKPHDIVAFKRQVSWKNPDISQENALFTWKIPQNDTGKLLDRPNRIYFWKKQKNPGKL